MLHFSGLPGLGANSTDVDLEAMPSSIFVNDDDDDDDITDVFFVVTNIYIVSISAEAMWTHL